MSGRRVCGVEGATFGIPPQTTTVYCQLPEGHWSRHYGRAGNWIEDWGSSRRPSAHPQNLVAG